MILKVKMGVKRISKKSNQALKLMNNKSLTYARVA